MRSAHSIALLLALASLAGCTAPEGSEASSTPEATTSAGPSVAGASPAGATPTAGSPAPGGGGAGGPTPATTQAPPAGATPGGVAESAAGAPLRVTLELRDAAALYGNGSALTLLVRGDAFERIEAGISLPPGLELLDGELRWNGSLDAGATRTIEAFVRARDPGEHTLRGWAEARVAPGSRIAPSATLLVRGDATSATAAPATPGATAAAFQITLEPVEGDPSAAILTASSTLATTARLVLVLPEGATLASGTTEEMVDLQPDELLTRALAITMPAGSAELDRVTLAAFFAPDPAVDGRLFSDRLYYTWTQGAWRVSETAPEG